MTLHIFFLRLLGAILYPTLYIAMFAALLALGFAPFFLLIGAGLPQTGPIGFATGLCFAYISLGLLLHKPILAFIGYCIDLQSRILRTYHLL